MVRGSAQGRLGVGFVSGERGIGKSSLTRFVRHLAEREHDAVGCHVFLGGVNDLGDALRRTYERLLNESVDKPWHRQLQAFFGDRVRKVGLFGVTFELDLPERELSTVKRSFAASIRRLLDSLKADKRSLLLILDDINGLAGSDEFANWLKSTVDEIATSEQETRLCLLVVGLDARRRELVRRQPSRAGARRAGQLPPPHAGSRRAGVRSGNPGRAPLPDSSSRAVRAHGVPADREEVSRRACRMPT